MALNLADILFTRQAAQSTLPIAKQRLPPRKPKIWGCRLFKARTGHFPCGSAFFYHVNYRHQFHAGNFADVAKHTLFLQLLRAMQRKEKGFLCLDTHAGRGGYSLAPDEPTDSGARSSEHRDGIGRLLALPSEKIAELPSALRDYLQLVLQLNSSALIGKVSSTPNLYPGSPQIARMLLRPQDRLALCEKHPEECAALRENFLRAKRISIQCLDGYTGIRALLPPPEKRALILIDPPFEAQDEFAQIHAALQEGLRRMPGATFAVWYPMTDRAAAEAFFARIENTDFPPTLAAEFSIAGNSSAISLRGSGLAVVNPPWQIAEEMRAALEALVPLLAQGPDAAAEVRWIVPAR